MATGKGAGQSNRHTSYLFLFFSPRWEISDSSQCRFSCPFKQLHPHGPESMACIYWETLSPTIPHSHPYESRVPSGSACCSLQYHGPSSVHETLGILKAQIKDLRLRCSRAYFRHWQSLCTGIGLSTTSVTTHSPNTIVLTIKNKKNKQK